MIYHSRIYDFWDYRAFLKDRYHQLKVSDPAFSFRHFSKTAGFGSPNYLKLVMDGKRNLSDEAILKFAKGLRLDVHETEFFKYLVEFNQCESLPKKKLYEAKLIYLKELFAVKDLIPELYDYYHDWYHSAIRQLIQTRGALEHNPKTIAQSLVPNITEEEAVCSIDLLRKLNFVTINENNKLECAEVSDFMKLESVEKAQKIYFEQMAELAAKSIYTQGPETQEFECLTLSLTLEQVEKLKGKIKELVGSLKEKDSSENVASSNLYQFNIQLFALTKSEQKSTEEVSDKTLTG